jgi:hypothetical protein
MRFTLPALLGLTLLTWHQALALPVTPTKTAKVEGDITPYNVTASQRVDGIGSSPADATWSSTPLQTRLLFILPLAIANDMGVLHTWVAWKLLLSYTGDSTGTGYFYISAYPDGTQVVTEIRICIVGPIITVATGSTGGDATVQFQVPLEAVWADTLTNKVIAVFWIATYQFGQNNPDLSYTVDMNNAPSGYDQPGPLPTSRCPPTGGTAVVPTSWSLLPWSTIISNVQSP